MSEIGPESSVSNGAINGVAIDAGRLLEDQPAGSRGRIVLGEFLLLLHPALEVLARLHINAEEHFLVLVAAVFGALTDKQSGALRLNPHRVHFVGNKVRLACETRHPEAVHHVCRAQIDESWQAAATLTHGHVQFIGCYDALLWIPNFPPPLMPDDLDVQGARGLARVLYLLNNPRCRQSKDKHNEKRHCRPGRFNKPAAVNLCGFGPVIVGTSTEPNKRIYKQTGYD